MNAIPEVSSSTSVPAAAQRGILQRRTAPAPSVGTFLATTLAKDALAELAPSWQPAHTAATAALSGAARHLANPGIEVFGLFDLVLGRAEELLEDWRGEPWTRWRGRFAFVAFVPESRRWFAVTDQFNTLPVYYSESNGQLALANSLAPMMRLPWCQRQADPLALFHYLNFACIPGPVTVLPEVKRLPPAGKLEWQAGRLQVDRWWRPSYAEDLDGAGDRLTLELREQIVSAVQRYRPGSDQAWGCFLSGGTDSSSIVSILARQHAGQTVHSYSIGFAEAGYDELDFARAAAEACGAEGHFGTVDQAETLAVLPRLVELYDQPFGNASAVPTLACASMAAADGRNLLLAGDGGDEIFGGNERYAKDRIMQWFYRLPQPVKGFGRVIGRQLGGSNYRFFNRIDNFTRRGSQANPDRFYTDDAFASECFDQLLSAELRQHLRPDDSLNWMRSAYAECRADSELHRLMALDLELAIAQNDLIKVDGACRQVGVGARFPFLDPDLVDYTGRLRAHWKLRGQDKRHLFKRAMATVLPELIIKKKKQGFGLPISVWMRQPGEFQDWMRDLLLSDRSRQRGWFQVEFVEQLFQRHIDRAWDYSAPLWQLAVLELWMRRHLDV
ncbi:asparagine synthetase B family protein [Pseudomarimonas arenosa]|uniref:asparagine synthase (glutamine-hydrolyzing) n=1 Tax=Pseudomarimonas arenosa TaxID=2774145 RepID=A0AAW3ZG58_9GAMM|nr:asparagine synthase C-terminal domain-containing protein [Pseudomarimonas arenosa]MBD8524843.1 hypothetical protein [Pseudomarimonas arenosa]